MREQIKANRSKYSSSQEAVGPEFEPQLSDVKSQGCDHYIPPPLH